MANVKKTRIESMSLDEISLVGSGDDPKAKVVISKAAPDKSTEHNPTGSTLPNTPTSEENMGTRTEIINKDDLPDEVVEYIEELEDALGDALDLGGEDDEDEDGEDVNDDENQLVLAKNAPLDQILKANPELAAIVKSANDRAEAAERIAKAERDARLEGEMISKAAALPNIEGAVADEGETPELAKVFKSLYEKAPEEAEKVEAILKAANAQLESGAFFDEIGKSTRGASDPVRAKAEAIRKEKPELTIEQAEVEALRADPSLYTADLEV